MVEKQIILSTWENNNQVIFANQGEINSRNIIIKFSDANENILSLTNKNIIFYAKKPDENAIFNNCEINADGETISIVLTSSLLDTAGIVKCEFQISDDSRKLLKVNGLRILVYAENNFSAAVESIVE